MKKTTILLVDDHPVVIEGLKAIISEDPKYVIAGEATDGKPAYYSLRGWNLNGESTTQKLQELGLL